MDPATLAREKLIRQLQGACSGELAAIYAYEGHARSVSDAAQRERIRTIQSEEHHHRAIVLDLLRQLGAGPKPLREAIFWCVGHVISILCRIGGWFVPMYGAGRLERSNIVEYEEAAVYAAECGHPEMIEALLTMAEVEWEHERFFRECVTGSRLLRILPLWDAPAPKTAIRAKQRAA
jgi:rubrerythrin